MQAAVTAVGVHNAMSKKKVKLFKEDQSIGRIGRAEKEKELKAIREA